MKLLNRILLLAIAIMAGTTTFTSCDDGKSYAELLTDENHAVNRFLSNQRVFMEIPADTVFEIGPNAPYYQIDEDKNIYMQVLSPGLGPKVEDDQMIYFRFIRYDLMYYTNTLTGVPSEGNMDNMAQAATSFRYQNFSLPSSAQWGTGIQMPLRYLPLNCEVNLIIKSQYGPTTEVSNVRPFLYHIRYYKSMI
ncbi:MAG: DUF4827 domain-containing protein [Firmicutes bacterium]|nr:DUF4827 domain-containing protein [Bacillota bacterium]MCM1402052.1 DUF4827 domain-containing protein [Bacteroides sp.]MCM1477759.1 DUF4827 domain-containing protein [Bacteroides sp.]